MSLDLMSRADETIEAPVNAIMPTILTDIYQPQNNISIWERTLPTSLTDNIEQMLVQDSSIAIVKVVTPDDVADWIQYKLSGHACADALSEDIALIVEMFCCLFDLQQVGLRLTALDKAMCPNFHVDHVPCRLVSTYVGASTQWLDKDDIERVEQDTTSLKVSGPCVSFSNEGAAIQQMQPGDVALLKGTGWEGNEKSGLVHRSPALVNERRLLLTLDIV
ncbi:DUF1826 domain-containing protein [Psychromonas sp. psych-6C06]|uniref:DUF1826 domain-containing protein n=1 Tax=Psychromonas sp. psych-6C06 TaxID=2058089 RepID=UPI000C32A9B5|nr:DUF1826 domain-containing protein [Psychromonas sp. psych-6C06]PKF62027.1 DUF1826 domain-containing protein [Psychromonas sp. psych-6C06]